MAVLHRDILDLNKKLNQCDEDLRKEGGCIMDRILHVANCQQQHAHLRVDNPLGCQKYRSKEMPTCGTCASKRQLVRDGVRHPSVRISVVCLRMHRVSI
jgi:hypothetical protein